jgi:hypothetical protein
VIERPDLEVRAPMQRQQKITVKREHRRLDNHSPLRINAAIRSRCPQPYGRIPCGCPTWERFVARSAATGAPRRCLSRRRRAQTTRFRVRRSFTADNIPCVRSRELFLRRTKKARQREPAGFDVGPALSDTRMPSHRIKSDLVSHFGDSTGPAALLIHAGN